MDRYIKDYTNQVYSILKEKYGIKILKRDILMINTFLFRNIVIAMLKGYEVRIMGFMGFKIDGSKTMNILRKRSGAEKSTTNPAA